MLAGDTYSIRSARPKNQFPARRILFVLSAAARRPSLVLEELPDVLPFGQAGRVIGSPAVLQVARIVRGTHDLADHPGEPAEEVSQHTRSPRTASRAPPPVSGCSAPATIRGSR